MCKVGELPEGGMIILAHDYHVVDDADYLHDRTVGAMMGPAAIRKAMQVTYSDHVGAFHVHMHDHHGTPQFSSVDLRESAQFMPGFWNVRPQMPHGAIVLSHDSLYGICWVPSTRQKTTISKFQVVGAPMLDIKV